VSEAGSRVLPTQDTLKHKIWLRLSDIDLAFVEQTECSDDHKVANLSTPSRRAIQRNYATASLTTDCIGREALAIIDVPYVYVFVLDQAGRIEQILIDRT
jgi:hypothetical protein